MPVVAPTLAGLIYMRDQRNKWTKRWLTLRNLTLAHAKNAAGKDEALIGGLNEWDIELVHGVAPGPVKFPKSFGFAVRRQAYALNPADDGAAVIYLSTDDPAMQREWTRAILLARTYALHQEHARRAATRQ